MKKIGLTQLEVMDRIRPYSWADFSKWFFGQTGAIDPVTGELLYYRHDVERFINKKKTGLEVWD